MGLMFGAETVKMLRFPARRRIQLAGFIRFAAQTVLLTWCPAADKVCRTPSVTDLGGNLYLEGGGGCWQEGGGWAVRHAAILAVFHRNRRRYL